MTIYRYTLDWFNLGGERTMKIKLKALLGSMALAMALAQPVTAMSADLVEYYDNGYLTEKSVEALRIEQKRVKAISVYEYAIPIASIQKWHKAFVKEANYGDWLLYDNYAQKAPILTANGTTPYTITYVDLNESPYYIEIPAGRIGGLVLDIYQRPTADLGVLGPDQGKGGNYLLLGPDQEAPANHDADYVIKSPSNLVFIGTRIINYTPEQTLALRRQHFVYKVGSDKSEQKMIQAKPTDKTYEGATGLQFWQDVFDVLKNEPVEGVNRMILTQLRGLGIVKSKGFHPNQEEIEILIEAADIGNGIAMVNTFSKKSYKSRHWENRNWRLILNQTRLDLNHVDYYEGKEIASYTYEAVSTSKGMILPIRNKGSKYLGAYVDNQEEWLDGSYTYEIVIPKDAPAAHFWSISVYDNQTRTFVKNASARATVNNRGDKTRIAADGSVKIFVGPKAPEGYENNWIETIPGKGWFTYMRFYGPKEAYFDRSWIMPDIKRVK